MVVSPGLAPPPDGREASELISESDVSLAEKEDPLFIELLENSRLSEAVAVCVRGLPTSWESWVVEPSLDSEFFDSRPTDRISTSSETSATSPEREGMDSKTPGARAGSASQRMLREWRGSLPLLLP